MIKYKTECAKFKGIMATFSASCESVVAAIDTMPDSACDVATMQTITHAMDAHRSISLCIVEHLSAGIDCPQCGKPIFAPTKCDETGESHAVLT